MTFHIYTDRRTDLTILSDGENEQTFATQADAIDAAVRIAQDLKALYTINYWRP